MPDEETEVYTGALNGMAIVADGARVILTGVTHVRYDQLTTHVLYDGVLDNASRARIIVTPDGEMWHVVSLA